MKIGLDIDGVLANFEQHFLKYLNLPRHSPKHWDDPRFRDNFHLIAGDSKFWLGVPPILHGNQVKIPVEMYVTARPIGSEITQVWLDFYNFPSATLHTVGHNQSKAEILKGNVDVFLDDGVHNYKDLTSEGVKCLLVTRNHNTWFDAGKDRVANLLEFQKRYVHEQTQERVEENSASLL